MIAVDAAITVNPHLDCPELYTAGMTACWRLSRRPRALPRASSGCWALLPPTPPWYFPLVSCRPGRRKSNKPVDLSYLQLEFIIRIHFGHKEEYKTAAIEIWESRFREPMSGNSVWSLQNTPDFACLLSPIRRIGLNCLLCSLGTDEPTFLQSIAGVMDERIDI
jgi:hypothetical protein